MAEVLLGTKPGKPVLTLVISACALLIALGAATWQVRQARKLDAPIAIEGTPLVVRPPLGWVQNGRDPGIFQQPVKVEVRGQTKWVAERTIRIQYKRWETYRPLTQLLRLNNFLDRAHGEQPGAAAIGGFPAIQITRQRELRTPWGVEVGQSVYRLACSPRGDEISVEYLPVREIAAGDIALLDAVCDAIRIEGYQPARAGADWSALAGLSCGTRPDWVAFGPELPGAPGFYLQGLVAGVPDWNVGVFRTWLAPGRTVRSLAEDYRSNPSSTLDDDLAPSTWSLGTLSGVALVPDRAPEGEWLYHAAWFGANAAQDAVLVLLISGPDRIEPALSAVSDLLSSLSFRAGSPWDRLAQADQSGRDLVQRIASDGLQSWWGEQPLRCRFSGQSLDHRVRIDVSRQYLSGVEGPLYSGAERHFWDDESEWDFVSWTLDPTGRSYVHSLSRPVPRQDGREVRVFEERRFDGQPYIDRRGQSGPQRIPVGPAFVAPPIESIAEWLVAASQPPQPAMIEVSSRQAGATHSRLLLPQTSDSEGRVRVLLLDDYRPTGVLIGFDPAGGLQFERSATRDLARIGQP